MIAEKEIGSIVYNAIKVKVSAMTLACRVSFAYAT